jgi:glycosyltransferase involved in cell wall biosynthesis
VRSIQGDILLRVKILHVADYLPDLHRIAGGAEFAARRTIQEQARAGFEIEVATLPADFTRQGMPWQRQFEMRNLDRHAPRAAYAVKQMYWPADPLAHGDLRRILRESRPDVVHFHNLHYAGLSAVRAAREEGIPSAWTIYDYWLFCPSFMLLRSDGELCTRGHGAHCVDCVGRERLPWLKPVKKALFALRPAMFGPPADAVDRFVVLSGASRDVLVRHGVAAERVVVIPQHGWTEAAQAPGEGEPVPGRLLYVGWVESRKGLHVVIDALAQVAAERPEVHLEVLGMAADARYRERIEAAIARHGLAGRVRFREKVTREELLQELRRAWLVTVPEQWENMSPVILTEAMAAGACVLASRVGGVPSFVTDGVEGLLATRDDPADFARQVRWSLDHPDAVLAMRRAARSRALVAFDAAEIQRRTMDLYRSITQLAPSEEPRAAAIR